MSHWNWPGLLFVIFVFPAAGAAHVALRWWAMRGVGDVAGDAKAHNVGRWVPPPRNAIDSSNYRIPPHEHLFDLERSEISVAEDGRAIATCAYRGCQEKREFQAGEVAPIRTR